MANATSDSKSRLFQAVCEAQDQQLRLADDNERARARARLLQAVEQAASEARPAQPSARPSAGWRWGVGTLAAAACAFAVLFGLPDDQTLEFEVDGVELASHEQLVAGSHSRTVLVSDTTTIELAAGGHMFIDEIRDNGATVVLERGQVNLGVHHEDDTSWAVEAGPYSVHVTGTQFAVEWEPDQDHFEVSVSEGSVHVEGPEGAIADLRAGDSLVRERGKATIEPETLEVSPRIEGVEVASLEPVAPEPASEAGTADAGTADAGTADADAGTVSDDAAPSKAANLSPKQLDWLAYFNDADYSGAWQALEGQPGGIHAAAKRGDAATLLDLADVARFTKHRSDAKLVLEQLRDRYPGTGEAGEAAFSLGRLAAEGGAAAKANEWFEVYLAEAPSGPLARDALARLMDGYESLGHDAQAAATAERYLARYPNGPHAEKALELRGE